MLSHHSGLFIFKMSGDEVQLFPDPAVEPESPELGRGELATQDPRAPGSPSATQAPVDQDSGQYGPFVVLVKNRPDDEFKVDRSMRQDKLFKLVFGREPGEAGIQAQGATDTTASRSHLQLELDPAHRLPLWRNLSAVLPIEIRRYPVITHLPCKTGGRSHFLRAEHGDEVTLGTTTIKVVACAHNVQTGVPESDVPVMDAEKRAPAFPLRTREGHLCDIDEEPNTTEPDLRPEPASKLPQDLTPELTTGGDRPDERAEPTETRGVVKTRVRCIARVTGLQAVLAQCVADLEYADSEEEAKATYNRAMGTLVKKCKQYLSDDKLRAKQGMKREELRQQREDARRFQAETRGLPTTYGRSQVTTHSRSRIGEANAVAAKKTKRDKSRRTCMFWHKPELRQLCKGADCPFLHADPKEKPSAPIPAKEELESGTVRSWLDKGFGFISPDTGGEDIYVHANGLSGGDALKPGSHVQYARVPDPRKGEGFFKAVRVRGGTYKRRRDVRDNGEAGKKRKRGPLGQIGNRTVRRR